jgi:hypothetical protein
MTETDCGRRAETSAEAEPHIRVRINEEPTTPPWLAGAGRVRIPRTDATAFGRLHLEPLEFEVLGSWGDAMQSLLRALISTGQRSAGSDG